MEIAELSLMKEGKGYFLMCRNRESKATRKLLQAKHLRGSHFISVLWLVKGSLALSFIHERNNYFWRSFSFLGILNF